MSDFDLEQSNVDFAAIYCRSMAGIVYRCPTTEMHTHAWIADEVQQRSGENEFVTVECIACRRVHLINPRTAIVLGARDER
jgi:hypothetical protein